MLPPALAVSASRIVPDSNRKQPAAAAQSDQDFNEGRAVFDGAAEPENASEKRLEFSAISKMTLSDNGSRLAYRTHRKNGKQGVIVDGTPTGKFDFVWDLAFGGEGKRFAFYALGGDRQFVVEDDGAAGEKFKSVFNLKFSPDGRRLVYRASRGRKQFVVINGAAKEVRYPFDGASYSDDLIFSPDSRSLAYRDYPEGGQRYVVGRKKGEKFDEVADIVFSPNSAHSAYKARRGKIWFLVLDGRIQGEIPKTAEMVFSPRGGRFAYVSAKDGRAVVLVDGRPQGPAVDRAVGLTFSADGQRLAYVAAEDKSQFIVRDGARVSSGYEKIRSLVFHPVGLHFAFHGSSGGSDFIVRDSQERRIPSEILGVLFSPDLAREVYAVSQGWHREIFVDGKRREEGFDALASVRFSPNGARLAYVLRKGEDSWLFVVDGQAREFKASGYGPVFSPPLVFSPDSKHIAYAADGAIFLDGERLVDSTVGGGYAFSANGGKFAYTKKLESGKMTAAVVDLSDAQ